ncbi:MAG TPA: hypothetical protein VIP57_05455 [Candidatus Dormibacteraeota bacterium]
MISLRKNLRKCASTVGRAIKKHSNWVLAVIGATLGAIGLYVALNQPQPVTSEQQELLDTVPPKVAWHCHQLKDEQESSEFRYTRLVQAAVECEPTDSGPEYVVFSSFASESDQQRYMRSLGIRSYKDGFSCRSDYLTQGQWTDATGDVRGQLICADGPRHANVLWSDTSSSVHFVAKAITKVSEEEALHRWWQRDVKYEGDGIPRDARQRLLSLLPRGFGQCDSGDFRVPGALVAISCSPGHGISSSGAALFPNKALLSDYIASYARGYPGASREKGCKVSTFAYTDWWAAGGAAHPLGKLLCYVFDGAQWFVWSNNRAHIYAFAARNDENWSQLWRAWSDSLSKIGEQGGKTVRGAEYGGSSAAVQYDDAPPAASFEKAPVPPPKGEQGGPGGVAGGARPAASSD